MKYILLIKSAAPRLQHGHGRGGMDDGRTGWPDVAWTRNVDALPRVHSLHAATHNTEPTGGKARACACKKQQHSIPGALATAVIVPCAARDPDLSIAYALIHQGGPFSVCM